MTIGNSSFIRSVATSFGGAIFSDGSSGKSASLVISSSTFANNTAANGGSIYNDGTSGSALLSLDRSTVAFGTATSGGGIFNTGNLSLTNTIVAKNTGTSGPDVYGTMNSASYSLIGSLNNATIISNTATLSSVDPRFGSLGAWGGPTITLQLLGNSPAIANGVVYVGSFDNNVGSTWVSRGWKV